MTQPHRKYSYHLEICGEQLKIVAFGAGFKLYRGADLIGQFDTPEEAAAAVVDLEFHASDEQITHVDASDLDAWSKGRPIEHFRRVGN